MKPINYTKRSQLQVDAGPHLKQQIKRLAVEAGVPVKIVVLQALATQYPELKPFVMADLN